MPFLGFNGRTGAKGRFIGLADRGTGNGGTGRDGARIAATVGDGGTGDGLRTLRDGVEGKGDGGGCGRGWLGGGAGGRVAR